MRAFVVVEVEVATDVAMGLHHRLVRLQVHRVIVQGPPEPLHEHVIDPAALAVHADPDIGCLELIGEGCARELDPLISVEDLRGSIAIEGLLQGFYAELGVQGIGETPGEHLAAVPVHDGQPVQEPSCHEDVADLRRPHRIGAKHGNVPQQVRTDLVSLLRQARASLLGIQGDDVHQAQQPLHLLRVHAIPLPLKHVTGLARPHEGKARMDLVDPTQQRQVFLRNRRRTIGNRRTAHVQHLALPRYGNGLGSIIISFLSPAA